MMMKLTLLLCLSSASAIRLEGGQTPSGEPFNPFKTLRDGVVTGEPEFAKVRTTPKPKMPEVLKKLPGPDVVNSSLADLPQAKDGTPVWKGVRIVCVGWKKTGTTAMNMAYRLLGMKPMGTVNKCSSPSCMTKFAGVEDSYACCNHDLVKVMKERYPSNKVKFVLTERAPHKWRKSVDAWIAHKEVIYKKGNKTGFQYGKLMGQDYGTPEFYEGYQKHNEFIKDLFKDDPDRLLVLNLEEGNSTENMQKFCKFVGFEAHPACKKPFPRVGAGKNCNSPQECRAMGRNERDISRASVTWNRQVNMARQSLPDFDRHVSADDESEEQLENFDLELATRDWVKWYADRNIPLDSPIEF
eukprot:gnl/MRDRNA2_/MRDRNA2_81321_c0_seq1.p1 gnl/MRDRNA2_/MRDRNA2_81321_c0~~gnl/MRDRNA2_/MRDRNA2_81321_c0_seq1.p1  ORF type:complete len:355 (-),score=52.29 gnl/MRDRNA2_/MRDRNA2_81321_c0_seq1:60-1124(-)